VPGIVRNYKAGSVIYFMGDVGDSIYILKAGLVSLTYHSIETGQEVRENIQKGEFFGVKSALAKRPREETATVLKDAQALVLTTEEFEKLISSNITIITNFLRVFSNQLRKVGKLVHSFMNQAEVGDSQAELFKIGEYYLKNHKYKQAQHVYGAYLKSYKNGSFAPQIQERLAAIKDALEGRGTGTFASMTGEKTVPAQSASPASPPTARKTEAAAGGQASGQPGGQAGGSSAPAVPKAQKGAAGAAQKKPAAGQTVGDVATKYYEAISFFSQEKFEEAFRLLKTLHASSNAPGAPNEYLPKIEYEMGRCLVAMGKGKEAVIAFTNMIKRFPKDENVKDALYNIGVIYKNQGDKAKAVSFFNKVLSMLPESPTDRKAKKELASLKS
jgi:TolA-binding protein